MKYKIGFTDVAVVGGLLLLWKYMSDKKKEEEIRSKMVGGDQWADRVVQDVFQPKEGTGYWLLREEYRQ